MKKIYILLIAIALIAATVFLHQKNESKENTEMERLAKTIADESDIDFEKSSDSLLKKIKDDQIIIGWLNENTPSDDSILSYIKTNYFNNIDLFKSYNITLTLCDNDTYLDLDDNDTEILCKDLFSHILETIDNTSINENLFRIDDATTDTYYLAEINFQNNHSMFIEFYKEKNFYDLESPELKNLAFCIYKNGILDYKFGNYLYPNSLKNFISQEDGIHKGKNFKHFIYNDLENSKSVVVTIEYERWMRFVAPFSIIFFTLLLAYFLYVFFAKGRTNSRQSFHGKMQITVFLTLLFSFIIVGFVSFIFLNNNIKKKTEITQYKQAIIIRNKLDTNNLDELKETFNCDINIYDLEGNMVNTTLSNLAENTDAQYINEIAYNSIVEDEAGYFMQIEYYGDEKCSSYYFPILNKNNELVAILNVPYFDSNSDYDDRISNFILNYINIIIVLLGVSSIIVLLITRKTLKPLKIIEEQMGKISLDGHNEPIDFKGRDEIGALVEQYNKMCQQLEIAANQIARNERETTWRTMARQVAHEIKNPLTPMRLNIEYLQMLWDRKDPKFEENLKETLNSLLEQIETLSNIATAFSDYAKLPENKPTNFNIVELLKSTIKLYDVKENITFTLTYNEQDDWQIFADKNNLGRVFGNIIKNAIQAIGSKPGHIDVNIRNLNIDYRIDISDNGCGIREEDKKKIFLPNFTTKSSGMGVGLSMANDIIQRMGGTIRFKSEEGNGTVFRIDVPILKEK